MSVGIELSRTIITLRRKASRFFTKPCFKVLLLGSHSAWLVLVLELSRSCLTPLMESGSLPWRGLPDLEFPREKESKPGCAILPQEYFIISISPKSQSVPFYLSSMRTAFSGNVLLREHDASDGEWTSSMARIARLGIPT